MKKITIKEFWNSKKRIAIHCKSEEEAHELLKAFDKFSKKWCDGESYLSETNWNKYYDDTCYSNFNGFGSIYFYQDFNFDIYDFKDIDLEY